MLPALRLALRHLRKNPGFSVTALATLAICLGANLAIDVLALTLIIRTSVKVPQRPRFIT